MRGLGIRGFLQARKGGQMESERPNPLEEREQRQNAEQQHGDTFAVDTDEPTYTSGIPTDNERSAYRS